LNQLLWYFSDLEKKKCYHLPNGEPDFDNAGDACMKWRRFANCFSFTVEKKPRGKERDYRYTAVMRALVWRYVSAMHRKCEEAIVTEDDVNELKSDISSFRYEILEVLGKNGMDISSAERKEKAVLGRKMKVWERRLMKDFKVAPVASEEDEELYAPPPENEDSLARFRRIAKLVVADSVINKWRQVVTGAQIASQIGHCHSRDSFKKQQNLQKAIEEAKRLAAKSPENLSRAITPIKLPDMTGSDIFELVRGENDSDNEPSQKKFALSPNVTVMKKQKAPSAPKIAIDPPNAPDVKRPAPPVHWRDEPDLINLESAKGSPVSSTKKSVNSSSSDSSDQVLNNVDVHASLDKGTSDDKKGSSPPIIISPPPLEDSTDIQSKKSLDSISKANSLDYLESQKFKIAEKFGEPESMDSGTSPNVASISEEDKGVKEVDIGEQKPKENNDMGDDVEELKCVTDVESKIQKADIDENVDESEEQKLLASEERQLSGEIKSVDTGENLNETIEKEELSEATQSDVDKTTELKTKIEEVKAEIDESKSQTVETKNEVEAATSCSTTQGILARTNGKEYVRHTFAVLVLKVKKKITPKRETCNLNHLTKNQKIWMENHKIPMKKPELMKLIPKNSDPRDTEFATDFDDLGESQYSFPPDTPAAGPSTTDEQTDISSPVNPASSALSIKLPGKRKRAETVTASSQSQQDPCELFLLSLVPQMKSMTPRQQLSFQKGILELIEKIKYPQDHPLQSVPEQQGINLASASAGSYYNTFDVGYEEQQTTHLQELTPAQSSHSHTYSQY
ncbi:hypothetical protein NQ314_007503, partial [Rhamnusium bicolor]